MLLSLVYVVFFLTVQLSCAPSLKRPFDKCPEPIRNFDVQRYSHIWYLAYLSKNMEDFPVKHCFEMKTEVFPNGTAIAINTYIRGPELKKKTNFTPSKFIWTPNVGQYYVQVYGMNLGPVNIFATDYDHYSIVWHCITKNPPDYPPVIIFTKHKHISSTTRRRLDELMAAYDLIGNVVPVPDCQI